MSTEDAFRKLSELASVPTGLATTSELSRVLAPVSPRAGRTSAAQDEARLLAEARYRVLIEQIPAVTFLASLAGGKNEIYVSPQIESLLGFTQEEWISDPVLWYRQTHVDDRDRVSRKFAALCATGEPFRDVVRVISRAGETVWVHAEAQLVRDEVGKLLFLQGVGFDVTEQYRAREAREELIRAQAARAEADRESDRLREVFSRLPAAIAMLRGADHVVEFLNPLALDMAHPGAEVGRPFRDVFPYVSEVAAELLQRAAATGQPTFARELRLGDSGERFYNFICQPLQDYRGPFLLTHAVEVTEEVRARREVEHALGLRDEFLSIAAHELTGPIAALQWELQLIKRRISRYGSIDAEEAAAAFQAMNDQAYRLNRLIAHLLDISRLEAGNLRLERQPTDLVRMLEPVVQTVRRTVEGRAITFDAPASLTAEIDPLRVEQVVTNLLGNAVKYSPEKSAIHVRVSLVDPDTAELSVRDHGGGVPPSERERLFERYYRASSSGSHGGLGLGLYICRQIVEMHGGSIGAEFPEAGGTRIVIRLPVQA